MNSIDLLNKLSGMLSNLNADDLLLPLRVNGTPVGKMYFSLHLSGNGEKYVNLSIEKE